MKKFTRHSLHESHGVKAYVMGRAIDKKWVPTESIEEFKGVLANVMPAIPQDI